MVHGIKKESFQRCVTPNRWRDESCDKQLIGWQLRFWPPCSIRIFLSTPTLSLTQRRIMQIALRNAHPQQIMQAAFLIILPHQNFHQKSNYPKLPFLFMVRAAKRVHWLSAKKKASRCALHKLRKLYILSNYTNRRPPSPELMCHLLRSTAACLATFTLY